MSETVSAVNSFRRELSTRIREVEKRFKNRSEAAKAAGVAKSSFQRWVEGRADPSFEGLSKLANEAGVSLDWLAHGKATGAAPINGADRNDTEASQRSFVGVPRYDIRLSAGSGTFVDRAVVLDQIPFTARFLRRKLGRGSTDGLAIVEAAGDSMEPTISDGDLVMVDTRDRSPGDGLYALVFDDSLLIKRLHRLLDGFEIGSDNHELYRPITVPRDRLNEVQVVGRVRWIGRVV